MCIHEKITIHRVFHQIFVNVCNSFNIDIIAVNTKIIGVPLEPRLFHIINSEIFWNVTQTQLIWFYFRILCFKNALKVFEYFKNKQESVWNNIFWHVKEYKRYKKCLLFSSANSNSSQIHFSFAILICAEAQGSTL